MQPFVTAMTTFRKSVLAAIVKSLLRGKTLIQAILAYCASPLSTKRGRTSSKKRRTIEEFLKDAETELLGPISGHGLQELSESLRKQYLERLQTHMECMLPSYSHLLPAGTERGQFLALDVGGSTLRVALVELRGRLVKEGEESEIVSMRNFFISPEIKDLEGMAFFEWMAMRIGEVLQDGLKEGHDPDKPIPMALAWSFPIE
jgi:hexokinase